MRVVVIGAGIVGAALAARLAEAGVEVVLVDAGTPGGGTSRTSLAWLNANQKLPRAYFDLNVEGMRAWQRLAAEFGNPPWYVPTGNLAWAETDAANEELHARVERLRDWGYAAELLTDRQVSELEPGLRLPLGAEVAFFPGEGFAHAARAVESLVTRATTAGATVVTDDPVVDFSTEGGRVTAARLASGAAITGDAFACCAGWRTPDLAALLGVTVPLVPPSAPGSKAPCLTAMTGPVTPSLGRVVHAPHVHARPTEGGGVWLEDAHAQVDLTTPADQLDQAAGELLRRGAQILPALADGHVRDARLCVRPLPVDGYPIVGWCRQIEGFYLAVTHSGVTLAARLAQLVTDEIAGGRRAEALEPYRLDRFQSP
ncbi:MAG: NAD(P)/FAD-dependent oxidoreductase [Egibacteraceae bacterium]